MSMNTDTKIERLDASHIKITASIALSGLKPPLDQKSWRLVNLWATDFYQQILAENGWKDWLTEKFVCEERTTPDATQVWLDISIDANVRPEIALPDLAQLVIKVEALDVAEGEVNAVLERVHKNHATFSAPPGAPGSDEALRLSIEERLVSYQRPEQVLQARDMALKLLMQITAIPVPYHLADVLTLRQLAQEGKKVDELPNLTVKNLRLAYARLLQQQMLIDAIGEKYQITVSDDEFDQHLANLASFIRMSQDEFMAKAKAANQLEAFWVEVGRRNTLDFVIRQATVIDSNNVRLDLGDWLGAKAGLPGASPMVLSSRDWRANRAVAG